MTPSRFVFAIPFVIVAAFLASGSAQEKQEKQERPAVAHQVVRVTEPNAPGPVEVSVAINPTNPDHIVGASQQGPTNVAYVSKDAGKSWKTFRAANPGKRVQGDDLVAFTGDGLALHTYIAFQGIRQDRPSRAVNGIFVRTSSDGEKWSDPVPVIDHINSVQPFEDKPWIRADNAKDSKHKGNIYVAWTKFDEYGSKDPVRKTHIYFSRSKDNGKTFSPSHRISETPGDCVDKSQTVMGTSIAVGPKGEVYVVWAGPKGLAFCKSMDGGFKFGKEKVLTETPGAWDFAVKGLARCNGCPVAGVDLSDGPNRGTIYVNWADKRNGDPDIFVMSSKDGGDTWTEPMRVNDDPKGNGKEQFFTWMAVDPVDGAINIVFYDRRDTEGVKTGLTMARSIDGGKTFVNHKINQEPFATVSGAFFGDYIGIDAHGGRVVAMYMHFAEKNRLAISAAIFNFKQGTQEVQVEKK
jgi:hypothetical protein